MTEAQCDTVAIVDDDDAVRHSLQLLLEATGHKVEAFASAVDFLSAQLESLACLILDHHMPDMVGLELAARLREAGNPIPIVLITASPSRDILTRAAELGIDRVLEKPLNEDELVDFIDHSMQLRRDQDSSNRSLT